MEAVTLVEAEVDPTFSTREELLAELDNLRRAYQSKDEALTRFRESAEHWKAEYDKIGEIQFSPSGDNHHNAALCPYCNPKQLAERDRMITEIRKLREFETYVCQVIAMGEQDALTIEKLPR